MNKSLTAYLIIVILIVFLVDCTEETELIILNTAIVTNIDETGATFSSSIHLPESENIQQVGFVWGENSDPRINNDYSLNADYKIGQSSFTLKVKSTLEDNKDYYVRGYAKTNNKLIYGYPVIFKSKGSEGPIIKSFSPLKGIAGNQIEILGENFPEKKEFIKVKIGSLDLEVVSCTQAKVIAIIPYIKEPNINGYALSVSVANKKNESLEKFYFEGPIIHDFNPKQGIVGIIEIIGAGFSKNESDNIVFFGEYQAKIVEASETILKVELPDIYLHYDSQDFNVYLTVSVNSVIFKSATSFKVLLPVIDKISPVGVYPGQKFVLSGSNFYYNENNTSVSAFYGSKTQSLNILSLTENEIEIEVPYNVVNLGASSVSLALTIGNKYVSKENSLTVLNPWEKVGTFPHEEKYNGSFFQINGSNYLGLGGICFCSGSYRYDIWKLDENTFSWLRMKDFPGSGRFSALGFTLGTKAYLAGGINDYPAGYENSVASELWEYDPDNDSWKRNNNLPFSVNSGMGKSFTINGVGFIISDFKIYEYDPINDIWIFKSEYPGEKTLVYDKILAFSNENAFFVSIGTKELWKWSPDINVWNKMNSLPFTPDMVAYSITINNYGYTELLDWWPSQYWRLLRYDFSNDTWKELPNLSLETNPSNPIIFFNNESIIKGLSAPVSNGNYFSDFYKFNINF